MSTPAFSAYTKLAFFALDEGTVTSPEIIWSSDNTAVVGVGHTDGALDPSFFTEPTADENTAFPYMFCRLLFLI